MLVEESQNSSRTCPVLGGLLDVVAPVSASILKGRAEARVDLAAVDLGNAYARGLQSAYVFSKVL